MCLFTCNDMQGRGSGLYGSGSVCGSFAVQKCKGEIHIRTLYTLRGEKLRFSCHSERSEESLLIAAQARRFFTPLCSVQNDNACLLGIKKRSSCPWAV